jgi:hypothetical protein
MLPGTPETIKRSKILHGNIYLLQHTAQHSAMLEVSECQTKNTQ